MRASDHKSARQSGSATVTATAVGAFALLVLAGTFVLVLYALTMPENRPRLLDDLRPLIVAAVAGVPGLFAAVLVRGNVVETREQTGRLATIERQTNGELRQTVSAVVDEALSRHLPVQRLPVQLEQVTHSALDQQRAAQTPVTPPPPPPPPPSPPAQEIA